MRNKNQAIGPIVGCLLVMLCVGIIYLWSVFKSSVTASFHWDGSAAKMVSSYMIMAFVVGCLLGGILTDKKGPRFTCFTGIILFSLGVGLTALLTEKTVGLINLTYAVMGGLGSGLVYNACIPCAQKWMPGKRGFASGLASSAFGLSTVVFTPLSKMLMTKFTDEVTGLVNFTPVFLTLACVFFVLGLAGCFLIRLPETAPDATSDAATVSTGKDYTTAQAMKTVPYWCLFAALFFINGTWNLTVPLIYDLGMERGLTAAAATFAVSFTGIPNAAGRLLMATVSDKFGRVPTLVLLAIVTAAAAILMIVVGGYWYIVVVAVIAFAYGGPCAVNAAFCTDLFGAKHAGTNYGVIMLALGLSSVVFNTISNKLLDGAVTPTFLMAAVTALITVALMLIMQQYQKKNEKEQYQKKNMSEKACNC